MLTNENASAELSVVHFSWIVLKKAHLAIEYDGRTIVDTQHEKSTSIKS